MDSMATTVPDTHNSPPPNPNLNSPEQFTNGPPSNGTDSSNNNNNELSENPGKCYDELFPALPGSCLDGAPTPTVNGSKSIAGSWGMIALPAAKSLPALRAINKTEFFTIASEERRLKDTPSATKFGGTVDGDQVSNQEKKVVHGIGNKTDTSIELSVSKMDRGLTVVINGNPKSVLEAKKQITKELVREAQTDMVIPKEHHRHVLGVKAQKLRTLEQETGTKITVPRTEENSEIISIKGPKEGTAQAAHRIQALSDDLARNDREELDVEKKYHVFIYGPNSKTLESIRQQTGAKIRVPSLTVKEDQKITIAGEKDAVAKAKEMIANLYKECKANIKDTSIQVPKEQHKYILGRGGQTLQDMFEKTGVWIEVPPQESDSQTITLFGETNKLGKALSLVFEKAHSAKKVEVSAPTWLYKHLIGKKGENINRIRKNKDTHVEFSDQSIKIEGASDSVDQVCRQLQEEIDDIMTRLTSVELHAPPSYHPHIIGKNGANVNRLKNDLNVKIHIPSANDETNPDVITIEGEPQDVAKAKQELEEMIDKLRNEHTRELRCESRLHGQIIGQGGEKISEIRKRFNQVNISFPLAAKNLDMITIRGDRRDVDECYAYLAGLVKDLQRTQYKLDVPLFRQFVRFLQSPKGRSILSSIQQETGAKVQLPKDGVSGTSGGSEQVSVIAEKDKAEKARTLLLEQQRKNADVVEKEVFISSKLHGTLQRYKRALLQSILEEAGCSISEVDVEFPATGSNSDRCLISGPKDMVNRAKARLEQVNERQLGAHSEELRARSEHHRFLIGRQGANIKKIREKISAQIIFPAEDSEDRETIVIVGREQDVKAARKELEAMITELENQTQDKMIIPAKYHKHFIARRAEVLSHILEESDVQVSFPKSSSGSEEVTLKGPKDSVAEVKQRLLEITKELDNQITMNCVIPQAHHRAVMGAKGVHVQGITREFGVHIKFPEKQQTPVSASGEEGSKELPDGDISADVSEAVRNTIVITGSPDKCRAAKAALEALVPVTEEVSVDAKLHRFIIGQKGKDVRELMDKYEVNIKVPQATEGLDIVRVTGPAQNVARCRVELDERIKNLLEEEEDRKLRSFSLNIKVPAKHHSKIVGRKGAVVTKLRADYNVQIQFPAKNERGATEGGYDDEAAGGGDVITVTGYEQNVCAACDEIHRFVEELENMVTRAIKLDHRIHSRIIGQRGRNVRKFMDEFKVEIKFPRPDAEDPDLVEIVGAEDNVENAVQHLKNLEDELMEYVTEEKAYQRPQKQTLNNIFQSSSVGDTGGTRQGFVVTGAPWSQSQNSSQNQAVPDSASQSDFPSFGAKAGQNGSGVAWGPRR